jgi:hypothetical protein
MADFDNHWDGAPDLNDPKKYLVFLQTDRCKELAQILEILRTPLSDLTLTFTPAGGMEILQTDSTGSLVVKFQSEVSQNERVYYCAKDKVQITFELKQLASSLKRIKEDDMTLTFIVPKEQDQPKLHLVAVDKYLDGKPQTQKHWVVPLSNDDPKPTPQLKFQFQGYLTVSSSHFQSDIRDVESVNPVIQFYYDDTGYIVKAANELGRVSSIYRRKLTDDNDDDSTNKKRKAPGTDVTPAQYAGPPSKKRKIGADGSYADGLSACKMYGYPGRYLAAIAKGQGLNTSVKMAQATSGALKIVYEIPNTGVLACYLGPCIINNDMDMN